MNSERPLFSLIIPTYNSSKHIKRCLESIIHQSFADFEILVIDGLSTDATSTIVRSTGDSRIKFFSERDGGIFDAMNKGISKARGTWLMFLGSDDELYNATTLESVRAAIKDHPKTRLVYGNVFTSDNYIQRYADYTYNRLLEMSICHQSIFYHRNLFNGRLYDLTFKICADWDFNLKVFRRKNHPVFIDRPLAFFNLNGASQNWSTQPEFLKFFADKRKLILRHRSVLYLFGYELRKLIFRIKKCLRRRIDWYYGLTANVK